VADALWPEGLTQSLQLRDIEETTPDLVIRSQPDVGPAKVRRRQTVNVRLLQAAMKLTRAQVATFDAWFLDTVDGGALSFEFTNPRTGSTSEYRFVERPRYRPLAPRQAAAAEYYVVTFVLEELPVATGGGGDPPPPPEGEAAMMLLSIVIPPEPEAAPAEEDPRRDLDILIFDVVAPDTTPLNLIDPLPGSINRQIEDDSGDTGDPGGPGIEPPTPGSGGGTGFDDENPDGPIGNPDIPPGSA
jgi:hypothetical protein